MNIPMIAPIHAGDAFVRIALPQHTPRVKKFAGLRGLTFYWNAFQIHNTGRMLRDYVGGLNTIAAIEANTTTRLSELWFEQNIFNGKANIRIGQLAADSKFF